MKPPFSTFSVSLLVRCLRGLHNLASVSSIHCKLLKFGTLGTSTANHLINAYLRCQTRGRAQRVFDELAEPNVVSWTSLMAGYVDADQPYIALSLIGAMSRNEVQPNSFTFTTAIDACARLAKLRLGQEIHAQVETCGIRSDTVVSTSLINMYSKCNEVTGARKIFDDIVERNVISWGSMISAYAQNADGHDALTLFIRFCREGWSSPNHFMFSSVVNACASVGRLSLGSSTHASIIKHGYESNEVIASALLDMYAKCGCFDYSRKTFNHIVHPSLVPYTSMIVSAAKYGHGKYALKLFDEMFHQGLKPNSVTFLGVLHACSHSGLVDTGLMHLKYMKSKHDIEPTVKHYTCVVDMLGRAGRLVEAYSLSEELQAKGDDALMLWSALISACRIHNRLDIAVEASKKISEFDRDVAGAYVAMSNTYLSAGEWESALKIRAQMSRQGIRKEPGCSWIEIKGVAYVFYTGNVSSAGERQEEVMELLRELESRMKERGYTGGGGGWLFDGIEGDEGQRVMVGVHSERLTLCFGIIVIPKEVIIRVMKNLRMCRDCHEAFKLISDIVEREFIVRDLNRFHHFKNGACTCGDYW